MATEVANQALSIRAICLSSYKTFRTEWLYWSPISLLFSIILWLFLGETTVFQLVLGQFLAFGKSSVALASLDDAIREGSNTWFYVRYTSSYLVLLFIQVLGTEVTFTSLQESARPHRSWHALRQTFNIQLLCRFLRVLLILVICLLLVFGLLSMPALAAQTLIELFSALGQDSILERYLNMLLFYGVFIFVMVTMVTVKSVGFTFCVLCSCVEILEKRGVWRSFARCWKLIAPCRSRFVGFSILLMIAAGVSSVPIFAMLFAVNALLSQFNTAPSIALSIVSFLFCVGVIMLASVNISLITVAYDRLQKADQVARNPGPNLGSS